MKQRFCRQQAPSCMALSQSCETGDGRAGRGDCALPGRNPQAGLHWEGLQQREQLFTISDVHISVFKNLHSLFPCCKDQKQEVGIAETRHIFRSKGDFYCLTASPGIQCLFLSPNISESTFHTSTLVAVWFRLRLWSLI